MTLSQFVQPYVIYTQSCQPEKYIYLLILNKGKNDINSKKFINSQGNTGNFTYLLEGEIHFADKLSVGCPI